MKTEGGRVRSLDGLRGLAALVVVFHHAMLTVPALAAAYYLEPGSMTAGALSWYMIYTPLHLLWAGTEAVYLFFILSGLVLALPIVRSRVGFSWSNYYPRRLVRLYLPVLGAVLFAFVTILLVARTSTMSLGPWLDARPDSYTITGIMRDVFLLGGVSRTVSPLWSLRWEVLFSLMLPLYMYVAVQARGYSVIKFLGCLLLVGVGSASGNSYLTFLPMFAVGVLIATEWDVLKRSAARLAPQRLSAANGRRVSSMVWIVLGSLAVVLLCSHWIMEGFGVRQSMVWVSVPFSVVGGSLALYCSAFCGAFQRFLSLRFLQWLGKVSFSLYLTHEPIVIAIRFLFSEAPVALTVCLSLAVSLAVSQLFFELIEKPCHRFARLVGRYSTRNGLKGMVARR